MFRIPILAAIAVLTDIGGKHPTVSLVVRTISNHGINHETPVTIMGTSKNSEF